MLYQIHVVKTFSFLVICSTCTSVIQGVVFHLKFEYQLIPSMDKYIQTKFCTVCRSLCTREIATQKIFRIAVYMRKSDALHTGLFIDISIKKECSKTKRDKKIVMFNKSIKINV